MFLFALLAKDLGFVVELIRTEFPDCQDAAAGGAGTVAADVDRV
jgi:hypothetical protein